MKRNQLPVGRLEKHQRRVRCATPRHFDRQEIGGASFQPALRGTALALGTVPVTAGVVGDLRLCATRAAQGMTAQRRAAAVLHGRHDLELTETEVAALLVPPCRPVGAEDIRDLRA